MTHPPQGPGVQQWNQPAQLVRAHDELPAALFRKRPLEPAGVAVVCLLGDNSLVPVSRLGAMSRYRRRYDVNIADQFHTEQVSLPAREDAFEFQGSMDVGWRVTDPVKVVERDVRDGWALVRSTLLGEMRRISRRYRVEECAEADDEINQIVGTAVRELPEGITVNRFAARLTLDDKTRALLQTRRDTGYESDIEQARIEATRRALKGDNGLLIMHLTTHRGDTGSLINLIKQDRDASEQRRGDLLRELLDRKIIQNTDLDDLARALVQQSTTALGGQVRPSPIDTPGTAGWLAIGAPAAGNPPPANTSQGTPVTASPPTDVESRPDEPPTAGGTPWPDSGTGGGVARWKSVGKGN